FRFPRTNALLYACEFRAAIPWWTRCVRFGPVQTGWSAKFLICSAFASRAIRTCGVFCCRKILKGILCGATIRYTATETFLKLHLGLRKASDGHDHSRNGDRPNQDDGPEHGDAAPVDTWRAAHSGGTGRRNGSQSNPGLRLFAHRNRKIVRGQDLLAGDYLNRPHGLPESVG